MKTFCFSGVVFPFRFLEQVLLNIAMAVEKSYDVQVCDATKAKLLFCSLAYKKLLVCKTAFRYWA